MHAHVINWNLIFVFRAKLATTLSIKFYQTTTLLLLCLDCVAAPDYFPCRLVWHCQPFPFRERSGNTRVLNCSSGMELTAICRKK